MLQFINWMVMVQYSAIFYYFLRTEIFQFSVDMYLCDVLDPGSVLG